MNTHPDALWLVQGVMWLAAVWHLLLTDRKNPPLGLAAGHKPIYNGTLLSPHITKVR